MEIIGGVASGIALTDATARLAHSCLRLYEFWESMRDAPGDVADILNDLDMIQAILHDISNQKKDVIPPVKRALLGCLERVAALEDFVRDFDSGFSRGSRKERYWTAFKFTGKAKKLEKFRRSLSETKNSLALGLTWQSILNPNITVTNQETHVSIVTPTTLGTDQPQRAKGAASVDPVPDVPPPAYSPGEPTAAEPTPPAPPVTPAAPKTEPNTMKAIVSSKAVELFLQNSLHMAVDNLIASGTIQELMDRTVTQVTSFETTASGTYTGDGFELRQDGHGTPVTGGGRRQSAPAEGSQHSPNAGQRRHSQGGPRLSRSRVCHQTSSTGVLLGSVWTRTSTLKVEDGGNSAAGKLEVITSFIFYPASWLTKIGLGYGTEASLNYSAARGWKFNFSPVRAVSESSLIFDLCRRGEVGAVQLMLERGDASVRDTSPKGWSPLHFAAAAGHVDLCAALIEAGADKNALAYEGPTQNALSPVTMFAESTPSLSASEKIRMLRLFADTLDVSDPSGDGWTVITSLVKALRKEKVPMTEISVNWLVRETSVEPVIAFGAKTIWDGLQHAVRSFLSHEQDNQTLRGLLKPDDVENCKKGHWDEVEMQSQMVAMSHWLALRATQRELLPMIVEAGRFLKMRGFDWVEDEITPTPREFVRALPVLYTTWSHTLPSSIEKLKYLIEAEMESVLGSLGINRERLKEAVWAAEQEQQEDSVSQDNAGVESSMVCGDCRDSYVKLGTGLVQPRLIAFDECRKTGHRVECECAAFLHDTGLSEALCTTDSNAADEGDSDVDEEFFTENEDTLDRLCEAYDKLHIQDARTDPFQDAAILLYRAQARKWLGSYACNEVLCATCFLKRERYIGANDGRESEFDFTPMPESYGVFESDYPLASTLAT